MASEGFFGTDGIRDLHDEGRLSPQNVVRIGRGLGAFARERHGSGARVCLARDTRKSGPALLRGIAAGLAAEGLEAHDAGVMPTPALAWCLARGMGDVAAALTASHNPEPYNGVKVLLDGGRKASPEDEADLERRIAMAPATHAEARLRPRPDALAAYLEATARTLRADGGIGDGLLLVDCAAGATRATAPHVLQALGARVRVLHGEGTDRAVNDRCGTEGIEALADEVRAAGAFGGLAFDGDGDRVLVVDEEGGVLDGDALMCLLAGELDEAQALPGRVVVTTVLSNLGLERALGGRGVRLERVPVGDRHVAARMRETGAALGGEPSGHLLLWRDGAVLGDGLFAGVRALQAAHRRGVALSACRREVVRVPQVSRNVRVDGRVPLERWPSLSDRVRAEERALLGRGRVLVRWSGTEPLLRIMVEGDEESLVLAAAQRIEDEARRGAPVG